MKKTYTAFALLLGLCLLSSTAHAQPQLVTDFNPGPADGLDRFNLAGAYLDSTAYVMPVIDADGGTELGLLEGGELRLVKDINPGEASSDPQSLVSWRGEVYFTAQDADGFRAIWATDGTEAGTRRAIELGSSNLGRPVGLIVSDADELFFNYDRKLYRSVDGQSAEELLDRVLFRESNGPGSANYAKYLDGVAVFRKFLDTELELYAYTGDSLRQLGQTLLSRFTDREYGLGSIPGGLVFAQGDIFSSGTEPSHGTFIYRASTDEIVEVQDAPRSRFLQAGDAGYIGFKSSDGFHAYRADPPQAVLLFNNSVIGSVVNGSPIPHATAAGKTVFLAQEENPLNDRMAITDGTPGGTMLLLSLGDANGVQWSNVIAYDHYVFFAVGTNNGFRPEILYVDVNAELPIVQPLYRYTESVGGLGTVQPVCHIGGQLYFSGLGMPEVGRELYALETGFGVISSTHAPASPSFSLRFFGQSFTIEGAEDRPARVRAYDLSGRLLRTYETRTNAMEPVAEASGLIIYQAEVDGQLVVGKWVQH